VQSIGLSSNALYHSILVASTATAQSAFDQLSGEIHASLRGVMVDDSRMPRTAILSRLEDDNSRGVWVEGFDNWGSTDIDDNAAATRHDTKGFLAGADTHIMDMLRVGFAAGWSHTQLEIDARSSDAVLNTIHVLGYAGVNIDALRVNAGVGYAHSNIQTMRTVSYTGYSDMLEGNYDGSILQAFGEAAYAVPFHGYDISPFGNVAVVDAHTADFAEQGGLASLSGENKSETSTFTTLGGRFQTPQDAEFSVTADVGWRHTFGTATPLSTLDLAGSTPFSVDGMSTDRDAVATNLGVAWRVWPGLTASAAYNGILSENSHDDALRIKVTQDF
jgi:outer membrane autotransporter protein